MMNESCDLVLGDCDQNQSSEFSKSCKNLVTVPMQLATVYAEQLMVILKLLKFLADEWTLENAWQFLHVKIISLEVHYLRRLKNNGFLRK